ncbi:Phosphatase YidA [Hordeum vulgare]|nr:Phosphatase YidA [Hordeum vulgare]
MWSSHISLPSQAPLDELFFEEEPLTMTAGNERLGRLAATGGATAMERRKTKAYNLFLSRFREEEGIDAGRERGAWPPRYPRAPFKPHEGSWGGDPDVTPIDAPDDRFLIHGALFSARCAYSLLSSADELDIHVDSIWSSKATPKVTVFDWLLLRDKLVTKENLHHKTIAPDPYYPVEDATHLVLSCPRAAQMWLLLGLRPPPDINHLWDVVTPPGLDINLRPTVALAIVSKIWDSCNAQVFRFETRSALDIVRNVISEFMLWVFRFKDPICRDTGLSWRLFLSSRCNN